MKQESKKNKSLDSDSALFLSLIKEITERNGDCVVFLMTPPKKNEPDNK